MSTGELLPGLSLGTLLIVVVLAAILLLLFLRRRSNRHPMAGEQERNVAKDLDEDRGPPN